MSDALDLWDKPDVEELYMFVGWRQWADAGSISSGLPRYLVQQAEARQIGLIKPDGFYLFQIPGTHDLVRPVVQFTEGFPDALDVPRNEIYYAGDGKRGVIFLIGDEPHLGVEKYVKTILDLAKTLNVKRIVGFGGVYGELPYDKERTISSVYSRPYMKEELAQLAVNLSDYSGGASIGSYLCRRAAERDIEYVSFFAFVPTYDFSQIQSIGSSLRIENDFLAWLGVMRRVNHMLKLEFDLSDLEQRTQQLIKTIDDKIEELAEAAPELGLKEYMDQLAEQFVEIPFIPLDDVWEEELRHLLDDFDGDE